MQRARSIAVFLGRNVKGKTLDQILKICEKEADVKTIAENVLLRLDALENAVWWNDRGMLSTTGESGLIASHCDETKLSIYKSAEDVHFTRETS
jgi:hypothetical protein